MTKSTQREQIKRLQQQVESLHGNINRIAEILNAVANRQVVSSSLVNGTLIVDLVDEPEKMALAEPGTHCPAIDAANLT